LLAGRRASATLAGRLTRSVGDAFMGWMIAQPKSSVFLSWRRKLFRQMGLARGGHIKSFA
jgi:hypothetical protein